MIDFLLVNEARARQLGRGMRICPRAARKILSGAARGYIKQGIRGVMFYKKLRLRQD